MYCLSRMDKVNGCFKVLLNIFTYNIAETLISRIFDNCMKAVHATDKDSLKNDVENVVKLIEHRESYPLRHKKYYVRFRDMTFVIFNWAV
jgi:hypothetical protein